MRKLLYLAAIFLISGCALNESVRMGVFSGDEGPNTARVIFEDATPYIFINDEPKDKTIARIKGYSGAFRGKSAVVYRDEAECVDFDMFLMHKQPEEGFPIKANKTYTFKYTASDELLKQSVICPNTFSVNIEPSKTYKVIKRVKLYDSGLAQCEVEVVDEMEKPIKIIPRVKEPLFWSQRSPRCDAKELESPVYKLKSTSQFKCKTNKGLVSC